MNRIIILLCLIFSINASAQVGIESMSISSADFRVRDTVVVTLRLTNINAFDAHDPTSVPINVSVGLPALTKVVGLASTTLEGPDVSKFSAVSIVDSFNFNFDLIGSIPSVVAGGNIIEVQFKLVGLNLTPPGASPIFIINLDKPFGDVIGELPGMNSVLSPALQVSEPLSVLALDFNANKIDEKSALLKWTTSKEVNNLGFEVMKSSDGQQWEAIGFLNSKGEYGNSMEKLDYTFIDNNPFNGKNYYKLKQVDIDGAYVYSSTKTLVFNTEANHTISLYPNPAHNHINLSGVSNGDAYSIIDVSGRKIANGIFTKEYNIIDVSALTSGTYMIIIENQQSIIWQSKFTKK